jgi:hypothetical protein
MSTTTLLLYISATGSVLTAASVAAAPDGDVPATLLAGDSFPTYYFETPVDSSLSVLVPSDELAVFAVDSNSVPVEVALTRFVDLKDKTTPPAVANAITVDPASTSNGLKVSFTASTLGETTVWMRVEPKDTYGTPTQTMTAQATVTSTSGATPVQMPVQNFKPGAYSALVTIAGFVPHLSTFTAP